MVDITLAKLKYRDPNHRVLMRDKIDPHCMIESSPLTPKGTRTFNGGRFKSKSSNAGQKSKVKTIRPRRRSYGPF